MKGEKLELSRHQIVVATAIVATLLALAMVGEAPLGIEAEDYYGVL